MSLYLGKTNKYEEVSVIECMMEMVIVRHCDAACCCRRHYNHPNMADEVYQV